MATAVPNALNGTAPERTATINVTNVTYTGLGSHAEDVFVADRGSVGDPVTGANSVTTKQTPVVGAPFAVYFGGLRQIAGLDYTLNANVVTFLSATFNAGNTIVLDYFVANP